MPNRLQNEISPYLLQHAANPVHWFPWGDQAFDEARRRDVPVFLSVGYATCYWCHVMERESFENEAIARILNESFIAIKVDREERPDVDEIYMVATQLITGHGGWPMNCFLEPEQRRPFWCGTYLPPEPRAQMPSLPQVLEGIADAWKKDRSSVIDQADRVAAAVRAQLAEIDQPVPVADPQVRQAVEQLMRMFDRTHGGFGGAPKFPQPAFLAFLLQAREYMDQPEARQAIDHAVRFSLDRIALGGIHDQVGGGFHRYSVDATWTIPHFEKMLYDNAQLALVFARAARAYDDDFYRRVVRRTLDYVLREMTHAEGREGLFSAQDAEVDHREGLNYLWTPEEFKDLLGDDADWAADVYSMSMGPNFRDPHHPDEPARSVLRLADRPDRLAETAGIASDAFLARLDRVNDKLLAARAQRKQPLTDDKVLASWNGLMIHALAEGAQLLDAPRYAHAALAAARFIIEQMRDPDGGLLRSFRHGRAHTPAFLEDHATLITALAALARTDAAHSQNDFDPLGAARDLAEHAHESFADSAGAYYDTRDQPDLFVRSRATYDGAMPSGLSLMLNALLDLYASTRQDIWAHRAADLLRSISASIARSPVGTVHSVHAVLRMLSGPDVLRNALDRDAATLADAATPARARKPVQVFSDVSEITVNPGEPAVAHIELRIAPEYHIIAARPGPGGESLIPLRVGLLEGNGVAVYAEYPEGEPHGELLVHTGEVRFAIVLEHAPGIGAGPGEPVLGVTFQPCTDTECLQPETVALEIKVHITD